jgi:NADH-quinone oxidoreductase subunit L
MELSFLIVVIPFAMFLFLGLANEKLSPRTAGLLGAAGMAAAAALSYLTAFRYFGGGMRQPIIPYNFEWLRFTDRLHIDIGILLDPISVMMLVVITTVSLMVHIYSMGYMKGESGFQRYYAFLSLFSFSMLGLVVATNIFQMYIFWELVGVSSYLLIGFYYHKPEAVLASKKAFITTRFADLGFLIGILILSFYTKTFDFAALTANNAALAVSSTAGASFMGLSVVSWALGLIFMGGAGKSAMFPLHIWLPDAMEGPTPVSALIHAATMVVAGVYLVARLFPVYFFAAPDVLSMIASVGAFTALFAALIAITQTDIKRVLAFSTISQIAYMMAALGVSGYGSHEGAGYAGGMFHLFTHAFFKALLFLGAGSVIHAVHSNEMSAMGCLRRRMPYTRITFFVACLAIAGIPPFAGFFSKDEILAAAFHSNSTVFYTLWLTAGLTAFYMFRLYFNIFWGKPKTYDPHHLPHESPAVMLFPLIFLGILSCVAGLLPFTEFISSDGEPLHSHIEWNVAAMSVAAALAGIGLAALMYMRGSAIPDRVAGMMPRLYAASRRKFYMDELWMFITKSVIFRRISAPIARFDRRAIDGAMDGAGAAAQAASFAIRGMQSGRMQGYAWWFIAGALIIAAGVIFY